MIRASRTRADSGSRGGWTRRPASTASVLPRTFVVTAVPDGLGGFAHNAAIAVVDPRGRLVDIVDWVTRAAALRDGHAPRPP